MDTGFWASALRVTSIVLGVLTAFSIAGAYYFERQLQRQKDEKIAALEALQPRELTKRQEEVLDRLYWYLGKFQAKKLVVGRDGRLYAAEPGHQELTDVNLAEELLGKAEDPATRAREFASLMESMPLAYVRMLPEARWDNPFVVALTDAGIAKARERYRAFQ